MQVFRHREIHLSFTAVLVLGTWGAMAAAWGRAQVPEFADKAKYPEPQGKQTAVLAGGCFWGIDAVYKHVKGVKSSEAGYSGGTAATATYEQVSSGSTGHAESVKIVYDPSQVSYSTLLRIFFSVAHNPTQLNYQGPDHGTQYRSVIFYTNDVQKRIALAYIAQLNAAKVFPSPIVTQVVPLKAFYRAEDYHQNYLALHPTNPYCVVNDFPKIRNLLKEFPDVYQR
jgi:peptide-methionine (S)-S-oxide reductase